MKNIKIYNFAKKIFNYPRSITGSGVRKTLKEIKKIVPEIKIISVKSNSKVFDWTIPKEWNVKKAFIIDPEGKKICDFNENNLHLMGYSTPVNKIISKNDLEKNLYSLPRQPNAIPYITSYYKKNWGFSLTHRERIKLKKGNYKILIDTNFKNGVLNYGEIIIPGKTEKEVFFSSYICHPSLANNEISGPSLLTFLTDYIKKIKNRRYTYRIIFVPETIGSVTYLSKNYKKMKKNIRYGFNLSCVGDERTYSFIPSRNKNTLSDKVSLNILSKKKIIFKEYSWNSRGSDERQYCSPGIDLPVCSVLRSKFGEYKEYHTSLDKLGTVVTAKGLSQSFDLYTEIIKQIEKNIIPKSKILCEPQMGKRQLYHSISIKNSHSTKDMMNVLTYSDGNNSIIDIANLCKLDLKKVKHYIKILKKNKLIEFVD
tara:strand:- start:9 stop:1286 length:1278 start_codon:yes stop_codon:yes gene_type:complete